MLVVLIDVENIENILKPEDKIAVKEEEKKKKTCKCKNTMCLRLHRNCLKKNEICNKNCGCSKNCLNMPEYEKVRNFVKDKTEKINSIAFKEKISKGLDKNMIHLRGCKCRKNKCQKNYCECFKNNIQCSTLCRCVKCGNDKKILDRENVKNYCKKNKYRKKHKLVFKTYKAPNFFNFGNLISKEVTVIAYVPHKNK